MSQVKVFEFAKQVGLETLVLMDKIKEWKLPIKNHMAVLDDEMVETIQTRLREETESAAPAKKKTATKKAAAKTTAKAAGDEEKPVKKITKKAAASAPPKVVAAKAVKASAPAEEEEKPAKVAVAKKPVIRRKAGEVPKVEEPTPEPEVSEDAPEVQASSNEADVSEAQDSSTASPAAPVAAAPAAPVSTGPKPISSAPGAAPGAVRRTNIIGRMDLSKARPPAGAPGGPRQDNNRPGGQVRNIRTGFVAAPQMQDMPTIDPFEEERRREKEREKKRGAAAAGGKEEEVVAFNSADFRKREVIFQPKKKKVAVGRDFKRTQLTTAKASKRVLNIDGSIKVADLAQAMNIKAPLLVKKLMQNGVMASMSTDLDFDTVALMVPEFNYEAVNTKKTAEQLMEAAAFGVDDGEEVTRAPVVTVMGHVDHGKTSLLDAIRKADVVSGEAGGITQHLGAYRVKVNDENYVTFIDTPGHEAFTAMRARGANVTDVAIIVVAADDGVMPQTAEAINHAKAAEVPIIIAVNKIDKPGANVEKIKQQLTEFQIVPEEWGGSNIFVEVSAKNKTGIKELLDQILLVSEVEDLKAKPGRNGTGTVIEARLEKGRGPVATLLVKDGTVRVGDNIVAGRAVGRVRAMMNDRGEQVKEAGPGEPVELLGLPETPVAGDRFDVTEDEDTAREIGKQRNQEMEQARAEANKGPSLEELFAKVKVGQTLELPLIVKADVSGSLEAVRGMLDKVSTPEVKVKIVHTGVGGINESDVLLASTAKGIIIGFNVRPDNVALQRAKEKGVEVKTYNIIYNLVDDVKKAMGGLLKPTRVEKQTGRAEVRQVFTVPKGGNIAGCSVIDGKITRSDSARLLRNSVIVFEGKMSSLKRFKDDVKEVASGYECGIGIENFNDIKPGDIIETFVVEEIARQL